MEAAGCDDDRSVLYLIDNPVLAIDAARPVSGELVLERLWFADAVARAARNVFDEFIDLT